MKSFHVPYAKSSKAAYHGWTSDSSFNYNRIQQRPSVNGLTCRIIARSSNSPKTNKSGRASAPEIKSTTDAGPLAFFARSKTCSIADASNISLQAEQRTINFHHLISHFNSSVFAPHFDVFL